MLKAGLRFPLSSLHHQLLQHLGLSINQISLNTWRVYLGVEVLYGAMSDGARRLTVREFLHCYHPDEIAQSKGMYSFVPRSPLLRLMCETLTLIGTGRVGTFSWKVTNGCVFLMTMNLCSLTPQRAQCHCLVCIHLCLIQFLFVVSF